MVLMVQPNAPLSTKDGNYPPLHPLLLLLVVVMVKLLKQQDLSHVMLPVLMLLIV